MSCFEASAINFSPFKEHRYIFNVNTCLQLPIHQKHSPDTLALHHTIVNKFQKIKCKQTEKTHSYTHSNLERFKLFYLVLNLSIAK